MRTGLLLILILMRLSLVHAQYGWFPGLQSNQMFGIGKITKMVPPQANCTHPTAFYAQKVDHFDELSTKTFQQQYQVISDYFKPGGPILYYQGAENARINCLVRRLKWFVNSIDLSRPPRTLDTH